MDPGGVDPPVVEVEQGAHGDREIELFVRPCPPRAPTWNIGVADRRRRVVDLLDETKQRLVPFVEDRTTRDRPVTDSTRCRVAEQFRRNCGVGFQSKRTIVALGTYTPQSARAVPELSGAGPRRIACVKRARCSVASGRYAKRCQICGYSDPDLSHLVDQPLIAGRAAALCSTSGRNIGFIGWLLEPSSREVRYFTT